MTELYVFTFQFNIVYHAYIQKSTKFLKFIDQKYKICYIIINLGSRKCNLRRG